ncbi:MAG: flavin reductase [Clostridia bacterium]|nr:flavin reductase [Clostridia bacterium]
MNDWILPAIQQLHRGAFLIVKGNPMTIGWAQFGVIWGKLCCTVYVRDSRYTYELLKTAEDFMISFPAEGTFEKELIKCGTYSGKDVDKMALCDMSFNPDGLGIAGCSIHLKARILQRRELSPETLDEQLRKQYYRGGGAHTAYIAEIVEVRTEEIS